jgi:DNA/RNA-binding domain of Phe-tRNA-synthetase-like protein
MTSLDIEVTPEFRQVHPDGVFGALIVRGVANRPRPTALDCEMRAVEEGLRARFPCDAIDGHPLARAYAAYFKRFGGRYPVVHQAKTILSGKAIESGSALVAAMFTAELDTLVLTSGHDLDALAGPLRVDVAADGDAYTKISGKPQALRAGDMIVRDREGVIASVLYGPDHRTRIRPESHAALFGAWCPVGASADVVERHLAVIARLIHLEWPGAGVEAPRLIVGAKQASS